MTKKFSVKAVDASNEWETLTFLKEHENYTLFLLGNYTRYGFSKSDSPFSGNFYLIRSENGKVVSVFCLTKAGNLLIESVVSHSIFPQVLESCMKESQTLKGVIGRWELCSPFWNYLKQKGIIRNEIYCSREVLYSLDLPIDANQLNPNTRLLSERDFPAWSKLKTAYHLDMAPQNDLSEKEVHQLFVLKIKKKAIWGYEENGELQSIAEFNSQAFDLAQVGGVYTLPHHRRKGYSRAVMKQMAYHAHTLHNIRKLIIFTGEKNVSAQQLYKSLQAKEIGHFALLFGHA